MLLIDWVHDLVDWLLGQAGSSMQEDSCPGVTPGRIRCEWKVPLALPALIAIWRVPAKRWQCQWHAILKHPRIRLDDVSLERRPTCGFRIRRSL